MNKILLYIRGDYIIKKLILIFIIILCFCKTRCGGHKHNYAIASFNATCISEGYTDYTCECGEAFVEIKQENPEDLYFVIIMILCRIFVIFRVLYIIEEIFLCLKNINITRGIYHDYINVSQIIFIENFAPHMKKIYLSVYEDHKNEINKLIETEYKY